MMASIHRARLLRSCLVASLAFFWTLPAGGEIHPSRPAGKAPAGSIPLFAPTGAADKARAGLFQAAAGRQWAKVRDAFSALGREAAGTALLDLLQADDASAKEGDDNDDDQAAKGSKDAPNRDAIGYMTRIVQILQSGDVGQASPPLRALEEAAQQYLATLRGAPARTHGEAPRVASDVAPPALRESYQTLDWMSLVDAFPFPLDEAQIDALAANLKHGLSDSPRLAQLVVHDVADYTAHAGHHWGAATAPLAARLRTARLLLALDDAEGRGPKYLPPVQELAQLAPAAAAESGLDRAETLGLYVERWQDHPRELAQVPQDEAVKLILEAASAPGKPAERAADVLFDLLADGVPGNETAGPLARQIAGNPALLETIFARVSEAVDKDLSAAGSSMDDFLRTVLNSKPLDVEADDNVRSYRAAIAKARANSRLRYLLCEEGQASALSAERKRSLAAQLAQAWMENCVGLSDSYSKLTLPTDPEPSEDKKVVYRQARQEVFPVGYLLPDAPSAAARALLPEILRRQVQCLRGELLSQEGRYAEIVQLCAELQKTNPGDARLVAEFAFDSWGVPAATAGRSREAGTAMGDLTTDDFAAFLAGMKAVPDLALDNVAVAKSFAGFCKTQRPLGPAQMRAGLAPLEAQDIPAMAAFVDAARDLLHQSQDSLAKARIGINRAIGPFADRMQKAQTVLDDARKEAGATSHEYAALAELVAEWRKSHPVWQGAMWQGEVQFDWAWHQLFLVEKEGARANTDVLGFNVHTALGLRLFEEAGKLCPQTRRQESGNYESQALLNAWVEHVIQFASERARKQDAGGSATLVAPVQQWLDQLPAAERQQDRKGLANFLQTRLAGHTKVQEKFHLVNAAVALLGDSAEAAPYRELQRHYAELQHSIRFCVVPEGSIYAAGTWAGQNRPTFPVGNGEFGVWLTLQHTQEARERSGGFRRYVENQLDGAGTALDARTAANFVDDVKNRLSAVLDGLFTIVYVEPLPDPRQLRRLPDAGEGWAETPLYYVVLRPPEGGVPLRKIPPVPTDLNFIDSFGPVVLPFVSEPVSLDPGRTDPQLLADANVKQRLVLRSGNTAAGLVLLEITATANGLPPAPEEMCRDLCPPGFTRDSEKGSSTPLKVSFETGKPFARVTRTTEVRLRWQGAARAAAFVFPGVPLPAGGESTRFVWWPSIPGESEGESVPGTAYEIQNLPGGGFPLRPVGLGAGALAFAGVVIWLLRKIPRGKGTAAAPTVPYQVPVPATPLRAVHVLRRMHGDASLPLSPEQRATLATDIRRLENEALGEGADEGSAAPAPGTDPAAVVQGWVRAATLALARRAA